MSTGNDNPLIERDQFPLPHAYVAPRSPSEARLAEIWRAALTMDRVGMLDDYNDLGGDSLAATIIFAEIEAAFGVALPIATLVGASTVEALAQHLDLLNR
jgi:acyl carrier protein